MAQRSGAKGLHQRQEAGATHELTLGIIIVHVTKYKLEKSPEAHLQASKNTPATALSAPAGPEAMQTSRALHSRSVQQWPESVAGT